jgi:dTDP-4-amino-4,6-dideoxygalactose transaminase
MQNRMTAWNHYHFRLREFEDRGVRIPFVPDYASHNAHMFYVILPEAKLRSRFIAAMADGSINTPFHYVPLHSSPAGLRYGRVGSEMKNTIDVSGKLVRLPLYIDMGNDLERVIDSVKRCLVDLL